MKLEKIFSCTHCLVSPAQLPPGRCNLLLFSVSLVCPVDMHHVSWVCSPAVSGKGRPPGPLALLRGWLASCHAVLPFSPPSPSSPFPPSEFAAKLSGNLTLSITICLIGHLIRGPSVHQFLVAAKSPRTPTPSPAGGPPVETEAQSDHSRSSRFLSAPGRPSPAPRPLGHWFARGRVQARAGPGSWAAPSLEVSEAIRLRPAQPALPGSAVPSILDSLFKRDLKNLGGSAGTLSLFPLSCREPSTVARMAETSVSSWKSASRGLGRALHPPHLPPSSRRPARVWFP